MRSRRSPLAMTLAYPNADRKVDTHNKLTHTSLHTSLVKQRRESYSAHARVDKDTDATFADFEAGIHTVVWTAPKVAPSLCRSSLILTMFCWIPRRTEGNIDVKQTIIFTFTIFEEMSNCRVWMSLRRLFSRVRPFSYSRRRR